jgi:hypothetical protein
MISVFIVLSFSFVIVGLSCFFHYTVLHKLQTVFLNKTDINHNQRFFVIFTGLFCAHFIEIVFFALCLYGFASMGFGSLEGSIGNIVTFFDYLYFSVSAYSTLGIGDVYPIGYMRFLTGLESVTGLMLIAWSATFFYFHMEKRWLGFKGK